MSLTVVLPVWTVVISTLTLFAAIFGHGWNVYSKMKDWRIAEAKKDEEKKVDGISEKKLLQSLEKKLTDDFGMKFDSLRVGFITEMNDFRKVINHNAAMMKDFGNEKKDMESAIQNLQPEQERLEKLIANHECRCGLTKHDAGAIVRKQAELAVELEKSFKNHQDKYNAVLSTMNAVQEDVKSRRECQCHGTKDKAAEPLTEKPSTGGTIRKRVPSTEKKPWNPNFSKYD
ncbi:hypothetical protein QQX98_005655 [Neonectria punicea]|uniref:Uncharacterized protein n=1 Tax=Neonectria punicea TaxID=979145 RepID=A0ABR1H4C6_9HYPO